MRNLSSNPGLLAVSLTALALACSQNPSPITQPEEDFLEAAPSTVDVGPREEQSSVPEEAPQSAPYGEKMVVIEEGGEDSADRPLTLVEAAQKERVRRGNTAKSGIVITDQNLQSFATGELTFADGTFEGQDSAPRLSDGSQLLTKEEEDEWRGRMLDLRVRLRDTSTQIKNLESEVSKWRQRFYLEEDDYHRDTQVKPAWDRTLEQLETARTRATTIRDEIGEAMEAGRRAGVPPGWLREGIEFEPVETQQEEEYLDPSEPVILEETSGGGR